MPLGWKTKNRGSLIVADIPEWSDLKYFLELARTEKLSEVALRFGVEHTTVSRRIDRLEEALGVSLFDRSRRGYSTTDAGRNLITHAEAIERSVLAAVDESNSVFELVAGKVRIGCPEGFGAWVIAPRLNMLYEAHPDLEVELHAQHMFPSIINREVDILMTLEPPQSGRYVVSRLVEVEFCLYGSKKYLTSHKPINASRDLSGHKFVDYAQNQLLRDQLRTLEKLEKLEEAPRRVFTSTSIPAIREAMDAGVGLGLLPPYAVVGYNNLVTVLPHKPQLTLTTWLAAPSDLFGTRRIRVVWDFIRNIVGNEPELFSYSGYSERGCGVVESIDGKRPTPPPVLKG